MSTYRVTSSDPADTALLRRFAPAPISLRGACGVSIDIARHLLGSPKIVNADGPTNPGLIETELDVVRAIRRGEGPSVAG